MMHPATAGIARNVRRARTPAARVAALEGVYVGQPCVIVTCGPSLASIDAERLRSALDGVPTIAIKQADAVVGDLADLHCFNSYNVRRFTGSSRDTIRVFAREPSGLHPQFNRYDIALPMAAHSADLAQSLAATRNFKDYEFTDGLARPWAPGIMQEVALYLAVHMRVAAVYAVGWDIAVGSTTNEHFDDHTVSAAYFQAGRSRKVRAAQTRRRLPAPAKRTLRAVRGAVAHYGGQPYNRVTMLDGEGRTVAGSIPATHAWLTAHRVDLHIVTDASPSSGDTPYMRVDSFFRQLRATAVA